MELEHTFTVPVPPEQAFTVLQDIERIGPCMPGATIESVDGRDFTGKVKVKIGPIQVTYNGKASYADLDEANLTATIDARGKEARGSGTANATVTATVTPSGDGAEVHVVTDLAVTGRPAQFGRGVMEEVGQKLINQFAECLAATLGEEQQASPPQEEAGAVTDQVADDAGATDGTDRANGSDGAATPTVAASAEAGRAASSNGSEAPARAAAVTTAPTRSSAPRAEGEAIDLLSVAGAPVAKRLGPLVGGLGVLAVLWWLIRRR